MSGLLPFPLNLRLYERSIPARTNYQSAYIIIALPMAGPLRSNHESHGFMKPGPPLTWCFLSTVSDGVASALDDRDIVAAYRSALDAELDILVKELRSRANE